MTWGHRLLPWPQNLTPAQCRCIEAVKQHRTLVDAAAALQISIHTINRSLEKARSRAGVHTTAALVDRYFASSRAPARFPEAP